MAENEAEETFLNSMRAMNESAGVYNSAGEDADGDQIDSSDEYDPAQVQDISLSAPQNMSNHSSSVDSSSHNNPLSIHRSPPPALANLVVNSSNQAEYSTSDSSTANKPDSVQREQQSKSPLAILANAQINNMPHATTATTTATSQPASAVATPTITTPTSVLPKARLPHDKIGILEDRIQDDEKGDIDAWLSLIAEHRKRGKLDEARKTYEKFFKVFPTAVRFHNRLHR